MTDIGLSVTLAQAETGVMSTHGTKCAFGAAPVNARNPADGRPPNSSGNFQPDRRLDSEGPRARAIDPTKTKDQFRCRTSGGLCGHLVLASTALENRHWHWWPRVSGSLGKCPRIERVLWRQRQHIPFRSRTLPGGFADRQFRIPQPSHSREQGYGRQNAHCQVRRR